MDATRAARPLALPRLAAIAHRLPYALAAAAFVALRRPAVPIISPDSAGYLTGPALAGLRPPTLPAFYALLGGDAAAIVVAQWAIGLACWLALAATMAGLVRAVRLRPVAFAAVLALAASPAIGGWDRHLLSESLAFSLLALLLAAGLRLLDGWRWWRALAFVAVAALWVGCRDTNAYALLAGAGLVALGILARRTGWRGLWVVAACLAIVAGSVWSARAGERGVFPLHNVIGKRVLTDPARAAWYAERGMPLTPAVRARAGLWASEGNLHADPALAEYRAWARGRGQATYIRDLATHPGRSATAVLARLPGLLAPDVAIYVPSIPARAPFGLLAVCGALAWAGLGVARRRADARWIAPALLIVTGLAGLAVAYHGDAMEVARHALPSAVQVWLGCLLLVLLLADRLVHRDTP